MCGRRRSQEGDGSANRDHGKDWQMYVGWRSRGRFSPLNRMIRAEKLCDIGMPEGSEAVLSGRVVVQVMIRRRRWPNVTYNGTEKSFSPR